MSCMSIEIICAYTHVAVVLAVIMIFSEAETLHDQDTIEHKVFVAVHIFQVSSENIEQQCE